MTADAPDPERDLETTVSEIAPGLLRYCRSRERDPATAEETAQDALVALVDRWRRLGPPDRPAAFVFTIARRRLARRAVRRRLGSPIDALFGPSDEVVHPTVDPTVDPERRSVARDELARVRAGIEELRPKLREALLLVAAGGLDTASAARVLGISPSALKMRVQRARAKLEDHLREPARDA